MKRTYCDACNGEIEDRVYAFDPLIHVCEKGEGRHGGYVETGTWEPTSGRMVHYDLCLPCYNVIHDAAYQVMKKIQSDS